MDIEELTRRCLSAGTDEETCALHLRDQILSMKPDVSSEYALSMARAVVEEVQNSNLAESDLITYTKADVTMGEFGVGSRGGRRLLCPPAVPEDHRRQRCLGRRR